MPRPVSPPIDREWALTLPGLRVAVPECWWDGYNGSKLCKGRIAHVDFDAEGEKFFMLELDTERGAFYPMQYDAVLHYADD